MGGPAPRGSHGLPSGWVATPGAQRRWLSGRGLGQARCSSEATSSCRGCWGGRAKPRGGAHGGRRGRRALCPGLGGALQGWVPRAQAWRPLQRVSSRRSAEAPGGEQLTLSRCRVPGGLRAGLLPPARGSEVGAARGAPASGGRVAVTPLSFLIGHFPSSLTPPPSHLSPSLSRAGLRLTHHHHRPRHWESPPAPQEHPTWPDVQGSQLRRGTGSRAPSAWA